MNMPSDLTSFTLTDAVLAEFPHISTSDVRAAIRRKCNGAILYRIAIFFGHVSFKIVVLFYCIYFTCLK